MVLLSHTLHVCHIIYAYIRGHWGGLGCQCRHIFHTLSVWVYNALLRDVGCVVFYRIVARAKRKAQVL